MVFNKFTYYFVDHKIPKHFKQVCLNIFLLPSLYSGQHDFKFFIIMYNKILQPITIHHWT